MATAPEASVRERKKQLTRLRIVAEAERLFEERGFDAVTVAEIAEAAGISVKTLFVYFRSKEDLAFDDTSLIDEVLDRLRARAPDRSHEEIVVDVLRHRVTDDPALGIAGFRRGYVGSTSLAAGLARMWNGHEDRLTAFLAEEAGRSEAAPRDRFLAMRLVSIMRLATTAEVERALPQRANGDALAQTLTEALGGE